MKTQQEIIDLMVGMMGKENFLEVGKYVGDFCVSDESDAFVQAILDKAETLKPAQELEPDVPVFCPDTCDGDCLLCKEQEKEETLDFVENLGDGVVRFNLT